MKKTDYLPVKLSPDLKKALRTAADKKDLSMGHLARTYIQQGLDQEKPQRKLRRKP